MNTQKGFTLLELVIVVAIVAILATIAMPSYQSYMIKTRRAAAAACLLEMSQSLERYYTVNMTYMGDPLPNLDLQCSNDLAGYYAFDIQNLAARAYLLRADPIGAQADRDPALCRALTIDQAGQRGVEGEGAVNVCWK